MAIKSIFTLCLVFIAMSLTVCDDDLGEDDGSPTFELIDNGTAYSVTGCDKSAAKVTIPATYEGLPVTAIGDRAFFGYGNLTSITIPESVTLIDDFAFSNCNSLVSITIPASVRKIGDAVFRDCTSLTSLIIPEGVTSIGKYAFDWCFNIASITIPASVTSIGDNAFYQWTDTQIIYIQGHVSEAAAIKAWGSSWQPDVDIIVYREE